jgi:hypothetical protein
MPMKLENGDAFESKYADWIRSKFPMYEQVWSAFIGHRGDGHSLSIRGLEEEKERNRQRFSQAHYSFIITAYRLDRLVESIDDNAGFIQSFQNFFEEQERPFALLALVGHIRDLFKRIDESLRVGGGLYNNLQNFYHQRSHVLHGSFMPLTIEDGFLKIPKIALENPKTGEWTDKSLWSEVDKDKFEFFADFSRGLRDELFALINRLYPLLFSTANDYFKKSRIEEQPSQPTQNPLFLSSVASIAASSVCDVRIRVISRSN